MPRPKRVPAGGQQAGLHVEDLLLRRFAVSLAAHPNHFEIRVRNLGPGLSADGGLFATMALPRQKSP